MQSGALIIVAAGLTAAISGLFGMGGGLIFMGIIAAFLPVATAMVVHGIVQSASNGFRAWLLRGDVRWDVLRWELVGALPVVAALSVIAFVPSRGALYLALGLLPLLLWLPRGWLAFDAARPPHAMGAGALVAGLNLTAGVAGPALDFFFVKTTLTRQEIVATKAVTMLGAHLVKIAYFGIPLARMEGLDTLPHAWVLALSVLAVFAGTYIGTRGLHLFTDTGFKRVSRYLVTGVGVVFLWRAFSLLSSQV